MAISETREEAVKWLSVCLVVEEFAVTAYLHEPSHVLERVK